MVGVTRNGFFSTQRERGGWDFRREHPPHLHKLGNCHDYGYITHSLVSFARVVLVNGVGLSRAYSDCYVDDFLMVNTIFPAGGTQIFGSLFPKCLVQLETSHMWHNLSFGGKQQLSHSILQL